MHERTRLLRAAAREAGAVKKAALTSGKKLSPDALRTAFKTALVKIERQDRDRLSTRGRSKAR